MVTENALFGYLGAEIGKNIVIFEISTHGFVKTEILTHTDNFCIQSPSSKVPGSVFSEGPGLGTLYKACRIFTLLFN